MPKWKPFLDFNPLDLPSLPKKDVTEARIVPTILLRKGYTFEVNSHNKVTMVGPGIRPTELCFGVYNLWFLMHWVEWTTGEPFNQMDDFSIQNKLGEGSVVGYGNDSGSWTNSVYRPTCTGDYWSFSDSGLTKNKGFNFVAIPFRGLAQFSHFGYNELPTYPGVWKRKMDSDTLEERRAWREALEESGFCFYRHPTTALLYFSNASNVSQGYPPTADLLGYPRLLLDGPSVYPSWCDQEHLAEELGRLEDAEFEQSDSDAEDNLSSLSEDEEKSDEEEDSNLSRLMAAICKPAGSRSEHEECSGQ